MTITKRIRQVLARQPHQHEWEFQGADYYYFEENGKRCADSVSIHVCKCGATKTSDGFGTTISESTS